MKILALNAGSSSLKFKLFAGSKLSLQASGLIENIGKSNGKAHLTVYNNSEEKVNGYIKEENFPGHKKAIKAMFHLLKEEELLAGINELTGIGHRVVHGGEKFSRPTIIDEQVLATIEKLIPLAPLHNPINLLGIKIIKEIAPQVPQVAIFDTAFHQSIPQHAFLYALPREHHQQYKIRRYGFHGTSHHFVVQQAAKYLGIAESDFNCISLHLGNGASVAAIKNGLCIDTSMGFTPLEGLIMGTRSGDLDPAIIFYLHRKAKLKVAEIDSILNSKSGLKGICGENDMRTITQRAEKGDKEALLALNMFCYRIKKYIGAYLAITGGTDCIIFTGGIGENGAIVRELGCKGLEYAGITLDEVKNNKRNKGIFSIHSKSSRIPILVVPTNEELYIAKQTVKTLSSTETE